MWVLRWRSNGLSEWGDGIGDVVHLEERQILGDKLTAAEGCFDVLVEMVAVSPPGMSVRSIHPFLAE